MFVPKHLQPRKQPQQERSRALVEAIVEATAQLLREHGLDGLTLQEVASRAGVSPGSLYQYYPHREALLLALLERQAERESEFLMGHLLALAPSTVDELIEGVVGGALAFRASDAALQQALLDAIPRVGESFDLREAMRHWGLGVSAQLRTVLAPFYTESAGRPTLDELVYVLVNTTYSLTHEGLLPRPASLGEQGLGREVMRLVKAYVRSVLDGR